MACEEGLVCKPGVAVSSEACRTLLPARTMVLLRIPVMLSKGTTPSD
jgi:hypothetical protein